jgi:hypothetical protein
MERIITSDREKSGRAAPSPTTTPVEETSEAPAEATDNILPDTQENITSNITAHITTQEDAPEYSQTVSNAETFADTQQPEQKPSQTRSKASAKTGRKADGLQRAKELAASTYIPVTLRMPDGLNDWYDNTAHEHRKSGVKKQELIALASQMLVERLENGEDLLDLLDAYRPERGRR